MFFICHRIHNIEKNTFQKIYIFQKVFFLIQECLGILAARCASCNCMTYFYCAPLQSCRRLYQLGD
ncbi:hypothetical protein DXB36_11600 [Dorea formicigenerans]|uniref:Uncharacterized protein n=1 Tax=Dorea formicigenerans TaxID=39486 RepID=A0A3E5ELG8_9FIRM|nr:hypothetical protein DXB36_11600 [Dorea formicigenerans]